MSRRLGLAVVSWFALPDQVAIQAINGGKTFMPKIVAMAAPTIIGVGAAVFGLLTNYKALATKAVIVSAVGDFLFIMHLCLTLF